MLKTYNRYENIVFCSGIGDFLITDLHLTQYEKKNLKNFYMMELHPYYKCYKIKDMIMQSGFYNRNLNFSIVLSIDLITLSVILIKFNLSL